MLAVCFGFLAPEISPSITFANAQAVQEVEQEEDVAELLNPDITEFFRDHVSTELSNCMSIAQESMELTDDRVSSITDDLDDDIDRLVETLSESGAMDADLSGTILDLVIEEIRKDASFAVGLEKLTAVRDSGEEEIDQQLEPQEREGNFEDFDEPDRGGFYRTQITEQFDRHLASAKEKLGLTDAQFEAAKKSLTEQVDELVENSSDQQLIRDYSHLVIAELAKDETIASAAFEEFAADFDRLNDLLVEGNQQMALITLDFGLMLSDEQRREILQLVVENWGDELREQNTAPLYAGAFGSDDEVKAVVELIRGEEGKRILNEQQLESLKALEGRYEELGKLDGFMGGEPDDSWEDVVEVWAIECAGLCVADIERHSEIPERVKRKLDIVAKAVASEIVDRKREAVELMTGGMGMDGPELRSMYILTEPPFISLLNNERWAQTLKKNLTDAQFEHYQATVLARKQRYVENISILIIASFPTMFQTSGTRNLLRWQFWLQRIRIRKFPMV